MLQRTMLLLDQPRWDDRPYTEHSFSEDMTDELAEETVETTETVPVGTLPRLNLLVPWY